MIGDARLHGKRDVNNSFNPYWKRRDGAEVNLAGVYILDRDTTPVSVADTTDETSVYSHSIVAGVLGATGGIRLSLAGSYANNSGGNKNLILRVKLGVTTVFTSTLSSIPTSGSYRKWSLDIWFLNSAVGAQRWGAKCCLSFPGADDLVIAATDTSKAYVGAGSKASAEDTSGALTLDVTVQHSAAHAGLEITRPVALLELIPAQ